MCTHAEESVTFYRKPRFSWILDFDCFFFSRYTACPPRATYFGLGMVAGAGEGSAPAQPNACDYDSASCATLTSPLCCGVEMVKLECEVVV